MKKARATITNKSAARIPRNIDEYLERFPAETQKALKQVRAAIRRAAPEAEEKISYAMPAFALYGNLVYFAG